MAVRLEQGKAGNGLGWAGWGDGRRPDILPDIYATQGGGGGGLLVDGKGTRSTGATGFGAGGGAGAAEGMDGVVVIYT